VQKHTYGMSVIKSNWSGKDKIKLKLKTNKFIVFEANTNGRKT